MPRKSVASGVSQSERVFEASNSNYQPTPEYNMAFFRATENYLNERLVARKFLFLNEVYEALGFDWTTEGQLLGWMAKDGKPIEFIFRPASDLRSWVLDFKNYSLILNRI